MACDKNKKNKRNNKWMKNWYANLSPSEKEIVRAKNNTAKKRWDENLTSEQRETRNKKERERYQNNPEYKRKANSRALFNRLGISLGQKEELFESQKRKCASCGGETPNSKTGWHTDHDHVTKFIRGILCGPCNLLLGFLEKQPERIKLLNGYLQFKPDFSFEIL